MSRYISWPFFPKKLHLRIELTGDMSANGKIPETEDERISFVPGWFQNTLPQFLLSTDIDGELFVHYDADIFSATLYILLQIDTLKKPYLAVFDEFAGQEAKAIWTYMQISGASIEFLGSATNERSCPWQASCRIMPTLEYAPYSPKHLQALPAIRSDIK